MEHKGTENLIPLNKRSEEEKKIITSMGGIASKEAKQKRKTFKEIFEVLLEEPSKEFPDITNSELMAMRMILEGHKGNTKAFEVVQASIGEKPVEQIKTDGSIVITMDNETKRLSE